MPGGGVQSVRVIGIHRQVHRANVGAFIQNVTPRDAAVRRPVDTALLVRSVRMSQSSDENDVWVRGMDDDAADLEGIVQAGVFPMCTAVDGLINAIARRQIRADVGFSGTGVEYVRVRRRHFQGPDRRNVLTVKDRLPDDSGVGRFPDAAAHRAKVKRAGIPGDSCGGHRPATAKWSDHAPFHTLE